ncbi:flagellar hook-associated protein FlgK [Pseudomonas sp. 148P]|uniref:Flagellar hook-associated protein 1 n=1 Tax=Pseudomonas ulcerans TaxID=3115852 RepID=A0ABU7I0T9_9PSED|nr:MULTISPECIES: flagellar hook-associated protein FlgK [unclassified Pseudomonas]MEE1920375.1 flagellar hook-associated protein FlgK [Pseudomonas sp. 147P]MEE1937334.1 flagellar hook-associated protein FlgK [Pseudomonas sp. 148P]
MASLISIGMSGLGAAQSGLHTTGNNIANADVAGYSRQQNVQTTTGSVRYGQVFIGTGTTLADVRRVYNAFLDNQLQTSTSLNSDAASYLSQITPTDNLLSDANTGVTGALKSFFTALQGLSAKPNDDASRQLLLTNAESLANRFNTIAAQFKEQNSNINGNLKSMTEQVNNLAKTVAQLNDQIAKVAAVNGQPNDLMDQRDETIRQLNELVGVQTTNRNGNIDVTLANGQSLVLGTSVNALSVVTSTTDPSQVSIKLAYNNTSVDVTNSLTGGEIGGLLRYRKETLIPAQNEIGRLALVLADKVNSQLAQGIDKNGEFGAALFNDINSAMSMASRSLAMSGNSAGSGNLDVVIKDTSLLSTSDYQVTFTSATSYTVRKLPDNTSMGSFDLNDDPQPVIDGFSLNLNGGAVSAGDSFKITPTRNGAANLDVVMTDSKKLAMAAPLSATAGGSNKGTGVISQPVLKSVLDIADPAQRLELQNGIKYSTPVRLVFGDESVSPQTYQLVNAKGDPIGTPGTFIPGQSNTLQLNIPMVDANGAAVLDGNGVQKTIAVQMDVSGSPKKDDSYSIALTGASSSDNRNGLGLLELQNKQTVDVGSATKGVSLTDAYGKLVESVGAKTQQAKMDSAATEAILTQAKASRDSLSGVQLDEEAGNLVKYQQYYTASSQIIKAAQEVFNTLISAL